jgi:hypothetical protein
LTYLFLAALVFLVDRVQKNSTWSGVAYLTLATIACYVSARMLVGTLWGLIIALTLALHPAFQHWATLPSDLVGPLESESLKLVSLAGSVWACHLIFRSGNYAVALLLIGILLAVTGALGWLSSSDLGWGLAINLLPILVLMLALVLGIWRRQEIAVEPRLPIDESWQIDRPPSVLLLTMCAALLVAVPALSLLLALALSHAAASLQGQGILVTDLLRHRIYSSHDLMVMFDQFQVRPRQAPPGLSMTELREWAWPWFQPDILQESLFTFCFLIVVMLFGLFRTGWRGWVQWSRHKPPVAWALTMFTLAVAAAYYVDPAHVASSACLPLATLAVLLPLFGIGDLIAGVGERIKLHPPGEQPATVVRE